MVEMSIKVMIMNGLQLIYIVQNNNIVSKGCPICRGLKVVNSNSLANTNPTC